MTLSPYQLSNGAGSSTGHGAGLWPYQPQFREYLFRKSCYRLEQVRLSGRPVRLVILGAGSNMRRVHPALKPHLDEGAVECGICDIKQQALVATSKLFAGTRGVGFHHLTTAEAVHDCLASADVAYLMTAPPETKLELIGAAVTVKVPLVIVEKPLCDALAEARGLKDYIDRAWPLTQVFVHSHYRGMRGAQLLNYFVHHPFRAKGSLHIRELVVVLREVVGIEPPQARAQQLGILEVGQHGMALACSLLGLGGWAVGPCFTARHPDAPIEAPVYGALSFFRTDPGRPGKVQILRLLLAKYQEAPEEKGVSALGEDGRRIVYDRGSQSVLVTEGGESLRVTPTEHDTGYRLLFRSLFEPAGELPPLLLPAEALRGHALLEDAVRQATPLPWFPTDYWAPVGFATTLYQLRHGAGRSALEAARGAPRRGKRGSLEPRATPPWPERGTPRGRPRPARKR